MTDTKDTTALELASKDLEKIKQCATQKSFKEDEVIFSEGDEANNMYFIESGVLSVMIQKFTQQQTVDSLKAGDCFGEMAFINGERRSASVIAITDGVLLVVDRTAFMKLLSEDGELASRIMAIVEARNHNLADKETLIDDHTAGSGEKFHLGIKGDPSLRESAFMRERYESVVDGILPQLQPALYDLLMNRCVYEVLIHFNSGEVLVKSIFNPFVDNIHPVAKLISKAYVNRHFALVDYDEKIKMVGRIMGHLSKDPSLDNLDDINRGKFEMTYKSWNPLKPKDIANTVSRLLSLRNIPDFYLRNFTISMIRDSIRLQFNCDGTHLLDGESYQEFLKNNLMEDDDPFEVDRRKASRRGQTSDPVYLKDFADRRRPPGRRQEDWDALYQTLNA
ncbi:MAG: cyclic nucleotide-binding domain-containing protein [Gammaproteobacteria bacterium]|nr:cyclic nucleotide-binding domain-containing protein [Gammaproteobacteria bacterium]MCK5092677.1 cyclic nucleotide-binding domain-containing protein [Gammaproteobacteria bacterium]